MPARCTAATHKASLGIVVDVGDAIVTPDGFVIGVVRDKNVLSVATVSSDLSKVTFADIGPARHEASPPQPFLWQNNVYIAWIDAGDLRLGKIEEGKVAMVDDEVIDALTYGAKDPPMTDLPAFDVATAGDRGIIVWEQLYPTRGEIHAMTFTKSGFEHATGDAGSTWLTISPPSSDADSPRLAPRGDGYFVVWTARAPEPEVDSGIEGPGESPSYRWLEAATLDANGVRSSDPKKLSPTQGHIAGYDVAVHDGLSELVARDGQETSKDEGTTLFRISFVDKPPIADPIANGGVGRAVPELLSMRHLTWVLAPDTSDAMKVFPILPDRAPPSIEPLLKAARSLAICEAGQGAEILAVTLPTGQTSADEAEIELISCSR